MDENWGYPYFRKPPLGLWLARNQVLVCLKMGCTPKIWDFPIFTQTQTDVAFETGDPESSKNCHVNLMRNRWRNVKNPIVKTYHWKYSRWEQPFNPQNRSDGRLAIVDGKSSRKIIHWIAQSLLAKSPIFLLNPPIFAESPWYPQWLLAKYRMLQDLMTIHCHPQVDESLMRRVGGSCSSFR